MKISHLRWLLLILFSLCFIENTITQGINIPLTVPSPNAVSLGIYGEVPISMNTGLPGINVPIYSFKGRNVNLDISLSYHAEGVRPEMHSGWVGSGWTLNAGGAITRVVKGMNDELNTPIWPEMGFYFTKNTLNNTDWSSSSKLMAYNHYSFEFDHEPDEFFFNFLGYSGSFYMNELGNWVIQSDDNLKIEFNGQFISPFIPQNGYGDFDVISKPFEKFIITDSNGTRFTFGGADAIEYTDEINPNLNQKGMLFYATSWHLVKIESQDAIDVVDFEYERGPFVSQLYKTISYSSINAQNAGFLDPGCSSWSFGTYKNGSIISPVYLEEIRIINHGLTISFTKSLSDALRYSESDYWADNLYQTCYDLWILNSYNSKYIPSTTLPRYKKIRWLKLDRIDIKTECGSTNQWFNLSYNNLSGERLFLLSLTAYGNGSKGGEYKFSYRNKHLLPGYLTTFTDHWGFNNGVIIPGGLTFIASWKNPNLKVLYGIIDTITYPTGGKTIFEFEPNSYSAFVKNDRTQTQFENGIGGGLRIKSIENINGAGERMKKHYHYVKNYAAGGNTSSGILNVKPQYDYNFAGSSIDGAPFTYYYFNSTPVIPLTSNSVGRHITYSVVVEVFEDGSFSEYKYSDYSTNPDAPPLNLYNGDYNPYIPFNSKNQERGRLLSKIDFNSLRDTVGSTTYKYSVVHKHNSHSARSVFKKKITQCEQSFSRLSFLRVAYLHLNHSYLVTEVYKVLNVDNHVTTREIFTYNDYGQVISQVFYGSDTLTSKYKYAGDYVFHNPLSPTRGYASTIWDMKYTFNFLNQPIEIIKSVNEKVVDASLFYYSINNGTLTLTSTKRLFTSLPISNFATSFMNQYYDDNPYSPPPIIEFWSNAAYETDVFFDKYDEFGNLLQNHKANDIDVSYIWSYNHTLPIAKVENATHDRIAYSSFENGQVDGGWTCGHGQFHADNFAGKSSFEPQGSNLTTKNVIPAGTYRVSLYAKNRPGFSGGAVTLVGFSSVSPFWPGATSWNLGERTITLSSPQQIQLQVSGSSIMIDEIRLYPVDALMTTYTHDPLVGVTSITDPRGITTRYQYDGFGRLESISDHQKILLEEYEYHYKTAP